jgi:DNA-binding NtrC family response regulator
MKVLFVDNDSISLTLYECFFKFKKEIEVITINSSEEALKILEKDQNINVVVSDYMIPKMSGIDFLNEVNKKYNVKKIMITGYPELKNIDNPVWDYLLIKPINLDELMKIILN